MKLKLIIFDLDGTLVDAYQAVSQSLNYAFMRVGVTPVDDETVKRSVGWGDRHLIESFVPAGLAEKTLAIYREHHAIALKGGTKFLPGAKGLLRELKDKGFLLAIASNRPTLFTEIILKDLAIRDHFVQVVCADKVARPKPYPDILRYILEQTSLLPEEALYVGDMIIDVETGREANVRTVAVVTGSSTEGELAKLKPLKIVRNVRGVLPVIDRLMAGQQPPC